MTKTVTLLAAMAVGFHIYAADEGLSTWMRVRSEIRPKFPSTYVAPKACSKSLVRNSHSFEAEEDVARRSLPDSTAARSWKRIVDAQGETLSVATIQPTGDVTWNFAVYNQLGNLVPYYWTGEGYPQVTEGDRFAAAVRRLKEVLGKTASESQIAYATNVLVRADTEISMLGGETVDIPFERSVFLFIDDRPGANWAHPCRYVFFNEDLTSFAISYQTQSPRIRRILTKERMRLKPVVEDVRPESLEQVVNMVHAYANEMSANSMSYAGDVSHSYFVLISGGADPEANGIRFWADTAMLYSTLTLKYGVPKDHIHVLISDGTDPAADANLASTNPGVTPVLVSSPTDLDGDGECDVDGPASWDAVNDVFVNELSNKLTANDQLFVFITSHGDSNGTPGVNNHNCVGFLYSDDGDDYFLDTRLHSWTKDIPCPVAFAIETCYSGGFMDDIIQTPNRVIATACDHYESSWGSGGGGSWGTGGPGQTRGRNAWAFPFNGALRGFIPKSGNTSNCYPWQDGSAVSADIDGNGLVSMAEADAYARANDPVACHAATHVSCHGSDSTVEHPQFAESTAGIGEWFCVLKQSGEIPVFRPVNDDFANAATISGASGSLTASSANATKETGEPYHGISSATNSVWWKWTASVAGDMTITTEGSGFDTGLGVYTGSSVSALTKVVSNDDVVSGTYWSSVTFSGAVGTTYYIAVAGYNGATGSVKLNWSFTGTGVPAPEITGYGGYTTYTYIEWNSVLGATGYNIYRSTDAETRPTTPYASVSASKTVYCDYNGVPGLKYYYWLSAVGATGEGITGPVYTHRLANFSTVSPTALSFDGTGGVSRVSVNANTAWRATKSATWLTISTTGTDGSGTLTVTAAPNAGATQRNASITLTAAYGADYPVTRTVSVSQAVQSTGPKTLYVAAGGSDTGRTGTDSSQPLATITRALALAVAGDTIIVGDGCYPPFNAYQKPVTIRSVNGPEKTVIQGNGTATCAYLNGAENPATLIGFTLTNGYNAASGGGVSGGIVRNCILTGNHALYAGGGAYNSTLYNCLLVNNSTVNTGGGGARSCTLYNCTIVGNSGKTGGGTHGCTLYNCIVWGNMATSNPAVYDSTCTTTYTGTENPGFVNAATGDYRLAYGSVCIDAGFMFDWMTGDATDLDANPRVVGGVVDMGAYEWQLSATTRPVNDNFANATAINDASGSLTASSVNATKEMGEPYHGTFSATNSVWWKWTASAAGDMTITTEGSDFDTGLGVYTGSSVSALTKITDNDDNGAGGRWSSVTFTAVAGTTYYIAVAGYNGATGSVKLNWSLSASEPVSDFIISDGVLTGYTGTGGDVTVPSGVIQIGRRAFEESSLTSVTLPDSLVSLDTYAFYGCKSLTNVTFGAGLKDIGMWAFCSCSKLTGTFSVPEGVTNVAFGAFMWSGVNTLVFPSSLRALGAQICLSSNWTDVWFRGNAPSLPSIRSSDYPQESSPFCSASADLVVHVPQGSTGWQDDTSALPSKWPLQYTPHTIVNYTGEPPAGTCTHFPGESPAVNLDMEVVLSSDGDSVQSGTVGISSPATWRFNCDEIPEWIDRMDFRGAEGYYGDLRVCSGLIGDGTGFSCKVNSSSYFKVSAHANTGISSRCWTWEVKDLSGETVYRLKVVQNGQSESSQTYSITYALGGGSHGTTHPTSATYGTAFCVSAPTRSGYTFAGWTVTSGLNTSTAKWGTTSNPSTAIISSTTKCVNGATGSVYFKNLTPTANGSVTLTANWTTVISLATALDNTTLTFTTGGDAGWFGQGETKHDGTDAAQSGPVSDNQSSWMQTTVSGPGTISFWWYASSESVNWDYLSFSIDGVLTNKIGGTSRSWTQCSYALGAGDHVLKWTYCKDGSFDEGLDAGFVDQVVWTPRPEAFQESSDGAYALFVGINQYTLPGCSTLPCCIKDVEAMHGACVRHGGWSEANCRELTDGLATKSSVRYMLASLAEVAEEGDTVLFYQSSHGGSIGSTADACLCMHDAEYWDYELAEDLMKFGRGVKLLIVVDACRSAGLFKNGNETVRPFDLAARVMKIMQSERNAVDNSSLRIRPEDIGWITAADYNQNSVGGSNGSLFTLAMADAWEDDEGTADLDGDRRLDFYELFKAAEMVGANRNPPIIGQCENERVLKSVTARLYSGFVPPVVISRSGETDVEIPGAWFATGKIDGRACFNPSTFAALFGTDYAAAAKMPTGKVDAHGNPMYVWQDFIAGTDPTNPDDKFKIVDIKSEDGELKITWSPDLNENGSKNVRKYVEYGRRELGGSEEWTDMKEVNPVEKNDYKFRKVTVDMP